jgi:phospholipase C
MTASTKLQDPIRHVVMLILENHSFDQMLGCFRQVYPTLEGVDPANLRRNQDHDGRSYRQAATTERLMFLDPHHEVEHVAMQLADHNGGFVSNYSKMYPDSTPESRGYIMGYYPLDFLPALHALARDFTICDHWFSSLPGPTWPNRFFALTGTANGRVGMPDDGTHKADLPGYFHQDQQTIFDRLNEREIHWKVYFHDIPQTTVLTQQRVPHNAARYFYIDEFFDDARGPESEFPQFCLIEPDYMGLEQNDDHPPHDIMRAEKLIADVYNSIRENDPLWKSTLLLVFYDEHGGFYDHVEPPAAIPPDEHKEEYTFDRLGVRVPAILISPWVDRRVEPTVFDHTSVLRYLTDKWQLGSLGHRTAAANDIGVALRRIAPREDTVSKIKLTDDQLKPPDLEAQEKAFGLVSAHQTALQKLAAYLKEEAFEKAPRGWATLARCLEAMKSACDWALTRAYDEPPGVRSSIAEPDKLAQSKDATPRDNVARFLMRKKKYAVVGLETRLNDASVSPDQCDHALQTLSLISGRKFHLEERNKYEKANVWLKQHVGYKMQ